MEKVCEEFKSGINDYFVMQQLENLLDKERRNEKVIQAYKESDIKQKNLEGKYTVLVLYC